jgi:hypothetical protein
MYIYNNIAFGPHQNQVKLYQIAFPKICAIYEIMENNMVEPDRLQMKI